MKYLKTILILITLFSSQLFAQVFCDADSGPNAYTRLTQKGYYTEVYDAQHAAGAPHIKQIWDDELKKYVFAFYMHRDSDLDPTSSTRTDRQRNEIKVEASSPAYMKIFLGDTQTNRWKFKLPEGFSITGNFCHIHQIKGSSGSDHVDVNNPQITLTTKISGGSEKLGIIYTPPGAASTSSTMIVPVNLAPFKGVWVDVIERASHNNVSMNGLPSSYEITIRRVSDDSLLYSYSNPAWDLYRNSTVSFNRVKYGLYRSIFSGGNDLKPMLRDETLLFADFSLTKEATVNLPVSPSTLTASAVSSSKIDLTWVDNSNNEDQFRIDRSSNGTTWSYLATAPANSTHYSDENLNSTTTYYYRIRSENTHGNSSFSNTANSTTPVTSVSADSKIPNSYNIQNYPNPFNPETIISYQLAEAGFVTLKIYDLLGKELVTLVNEEQQAGNYNVHFNSQSAFGNRQITGGTYFARISSGNFSKTIKLLLLK